MEMPLFITMKAWPARSSFNGPLSFVARSAAQALLRLAALPREQARPTIFHGTFPARSVMNEGLGPFGIQFAVGKAPLESEGFDAKSGVSAACCLLGMSRFHNPHEKN